MPSGFYLYVGEADALYEQALAAGAKSLSPPTDQGHDRVAAVEDPIGNHWFIARRGQTGAVLPINPAAFRE